MSTTDSTTTTATWQSNRARDLTRSEAALISSHWSEVTQYLVPPGIAWQWGECAISHKVKYNWKEDGLIRRAPGGRRWLTTETLWLHVIARADDDEVVGARAQGQQVLDAPAKTGSSRVLADDTSIPSRRVQSTLTGDTADRQTVRSQHEPDWTVVNARKGMHGEDDGREDAARHPGQSRLSTFEDYDRSNWDVTTPWFRSSAVTVPAGQVY